MKLKLPKYINTKMKTSVYIDAANMFYSYKTLKYKIDFEKLSVFLESSFNIREIKYYTGYNPEHTKQLKFLAKLEELEYKVIRKPIKKINFGHKTIEKANVDVELTIDAIKESSLYDNMILISGDSDFAHLVEVLQEEGKKVIVFSARGHVSKELIKLSDYYINFEKLKDEIAL